MADLLGLQQNGPDTTGMSFEVDTAQDRANALQAHNQNVKMSLLAAGLATLAAAHNRRRGERESLGSEIGQGGLVGLQNYESEEATAAKQQLAQQQLRSTNAYRAADLGIKGRGEQSLEAYRSGILGKDVADLTEKTRHDVAGEKTAQEGKDIAQENAQTNAYRASIDATRVQLEGVRNQIAEQNVGINKAKLMAEVAPGAVDTLKGFRGTAVEKAIPGMPDPAAVMQMPPKYAYALQKDIINTYARMKTDKTYSPHWAKMADNHLHKFWTDSTGDHDQDMGPAATSTYPFPTDPTNNPAVTGAAAPSNMPPPATPTVTSTPTAAATATPTKTATPTGTPLAVPKSLWGKTVRVDGKVYKIDRAGNPIPQ